jgi:ribosomal protein S18 acetylase RimI-like enzyme
MGNGNETASMYCRFLNEDYFGQLYEAFVEAFSDYVVPFVLTEAQFRNHIILTAVDLERTVGCLDDDKVVGFSLNGFGEWDGKSTIYDAGTGVIPGHRRQGVSEAMFELMLPVFKRDGIEQCLLEVVTTNAGAIKLYEKLGFHTVRELALLQCDGKIISTIETPGNLEIREIDEPDWGTLTSFWNGAPSWQNSVEAVKRSNRMKRILGAFLDGKCVGYVVFSAKFGRVAQFGVDKAARNQGVGTALLRAIHDEMAEGFSMQVINIDKSLTSAMNFFQNCGFYERLSQHEMVRPMQ